MKTRYGSLIVLLLLAVCFCAYFVWSRARIEAQTKENQRLQDELSVAEARVTGLEMLETSLVHQGKELLAEIRANRIAMFNRESAVFAGRQREIERRIEAFFRKGRYTHESPLVVQDPYGLAPLTALVMFATEKPAEITLEIGDPASPESVKHIFSGMNLRHEIPVFGLYAGRETDVSLSARYADGAVRVTKLSIATDPLPAGLEKPEIVVAERAKMQPGFNLVAQNYHNYYYIFDGEGEIRWYLWRDSFGLPSEADRLKNEEQISGFEGYSQIFKMLPNGNFLLTVDGTTLLELNALGKVLRFYSAPTLIHHDAIVLTNGNYLITGLGDENGVDAMHELDAGNGNIVKTVDFKAFFPPEIYRNSADGSVIHDWFHQNAVWQDFDDGSLLVSARVPSVIMKLGYPSTEVQWIWMNPEILPAGSDLRLVAPADKTIRYPATQHAVMILPDMDGNPDTVDFVFFDNNGFAELTPKRAETGAFSAARHMRVHEKTMIMDEIWSFGEELGEKWHARSVSDAAYDPATGNYLITFGDLVNQYEVDGSLVRAALFEVTSDKRTVFQALFKGKWGYTFTSERHKLYPEVWSFRLHEQVPAIEAESHAIAPEPPHKEAIRMTNMREFAVLETEQNTVMYDGGTEYILHQDKPADGKKFVIVEATVDVEGNGGKQIDLGGLKLVSGNETFDRIDDLFLPSHKFRRLPGYILTAGSKTGAAAFEVPDTVDITMLKLVSPASAAETAVSKAPDAEVGGGDDIGARQSAVDSALLRQLRETRPGLDSPMLVQDPYSLSPLTALVMFVTDAETRAAVTVKGRDSATTFTHEFDVFSTEHIVPVYGLYAGQENEVVIGVVDKAGKSRENTIRITTDPLPPDISKVDVKVSKPEKMAYGLTFFDCPHLNGNYPLAIDANGDIRWYLTDKSLNCSVMMTHLANGNLMVSSGKIIPKTYNNLRSVYEISPLGKFFAEYEIYGIHHDIREKSDGNLIFAVSKEGRPSQNDYIVEIERGTGKILREWDLMKILPMTEYDTRPPYSGGLSNWLHHNAIYYDEARDLLTISGRHQNLVAQFDAKTGELKWAFSATVGEHNPGFEKFLLKPTQDGFEYPTSQHAAFILPDDRLMLFDNRNFMDAPAEGEALDQSKLYSRAVVYTLDADAMTIREDWQYGRDRGEIYSSFASDVDYLGENHYLIDFGGLYKAPDGSNYDHMFTPAKVKFASERPSVVVEVRDDEVVFEAALHGNANSNSYKAERKDIYKNAAEPRLGSDRFTVISAH